MDDMGLTQIMKAFVAPIIVGGVMGGVSSYMTFHSMMGVFEQKLVDQEARIEKVESELVNQRIQDQTVLVQMTRVETKLDILLAKESKK